MLDRSRKGQAYPWLEWKVRLFVIGAGLGVGGMVLDNRWIVGAGMAVLLAGFLVRFLPGGRGIPHPEEEEDSNDELSDDPNFP